MPGRWTDNRERDERGWGSDPYWRGHGQRHEPRSFDDDRYNTEARFAGRDRDRVFGERDTGAGYNQSSVRRGGATGFEAQDYTRGGRYYGDDGRAPIYRSEYGQGGREYGGVPGGYDAGRGSRSRYDSAERTFSGGTGGYDYERGYGDGGREVRGRGGRPAWQDRDYSGASPAFYRQGYGGERDAGGRGGGFEDRAYQAGQGLRRFGERISEFLGGDRGDERRDDHRGRGPRNYARADDRIRDEVCDRLTDDPWLDASQIDVAVSAGEVTLSGFVDNREGKRRAERLIEDLSGVSNVQNDLRIGGRGLTGAGRGYGDSVLEAQMKGEANGDGSAMSRSPSRRT